MNALLRRLLAAATGTLLATAAAASPMTLTATSVIPDASDFSIHFDDDGDGIFQFDELRSFSGVSYGWTYDVLLSMPTLAGLSDAGGSCAQVNRWCFRMTSTGYLWSGNTENWTYAVAPDQNVPEPGSLSLAGLAAASLAAARRRRGVVKRACDSATAPPDAPRR